MRRDLWHAQRWPRQRKDGGGRRTAVALLQPPSRAAPAARPQEGRAPGGPSNLREAEGLGHVPEVVPALWLPSTSRSDPVRAAPEVRQVRVGCVVLLAPQKSRSWSPF